MSEEQGPPDYVTIRLLQLKAANQRFETGKDCLEGSEPKLKTSDIAKLKRIVPRDWELRNVLTQTLHESVMVHLESYLTMAQLCGADTHLLNLAKDLWEIDAKQHQYFK